MFSAFAAGAFFVVTGLIGYDVRHASGLSGGRWADGPIWVQILLGAGCLVLGAYWSRRLGEPAFRVIRTPRRPMVKNVGRGKSVGAERPATGRLANGE